MLKGILHAPEETKLYLLGVEKKRGRKAKANEGLVRQRFNADTPVVHPQQDHEELIGTITLEQVSIYIKNRIPTQIHALRK